MDLLTLGFLLFCIVLVIIYYLVPKAMQWWVLLAASLYFYAMSGIKNMIYVLITALSTYAATRMIQSLTDRQKEWIKANKKTTSKEERAAYSGKTPCNPCGCSFAEFRYSLHIQVSAFPDCAGQYRYFFFRCVTY